MDISTQLKLCPAILKLNIIYFLYLHALIMLIKDKNNNNSRDL